MTKEDTDFYAYFHTFHTTGQSSIDGILSAIAKACKSYHYTGDWNDDDIGGFWTYIQDAADNAANEMKILEKAHHSMNDDYE